MTSETAFQRSTGDGPTPRASTVPHPPNERSTDLLYSLGTRCDSRLHAPNSKKQRKDIPRSIVQNQLIQKRYAEEASLSFTAKKKNISEAPGVEVGGKGRHGVLTATPVVQPLLAVGGLWLVALG